MNDFAVDLEYSLEKREDKFFDNFYFRIFKGLKQIKLVSDIHLQKEGVDKILLFENGKQLLVDEKKRRKDYGDILLEEWSVVETRKKGWVGDPKKVTDYIVYAIMPSKKVYLLPYQLLQFAWRNNYSEWKNKYRTVYAQNKNYKTSSLCIPSDVLLNAIKEEMIKPLE